jgi:ApeA N-terminal domain 1
MSIFKPTLFEDFERRGHWWLPENPDRKVSGTLTYKSGEEITLELLGSLREPEDRQEDQDFNARIILGICSEGRPLTLFQTYEIAGGWSSTGVRSQTIVVDYLVLEEHFIDFKEMRFTSAYITYTYLEEWLGKLPFKSELLKNEDTPSLNWKATFSTPPSFEANVPSLQAKISEFHGHSSKGSDAFRELVWGHTASLVITPDAKQNFDWYFKTQFELRNLLSVLIGRPVFLKEVRYVFENEEAEDERDKKSIVYLYYRQPHQSRKKRFHPSEIIVPLKKVEDRIAEILEAWFSKQELLGQAYELFLGAEYNPSLYPHLHFLSLMQALETYHRHVSVGKYLPDIEYDTVRKSLVTAIPEGTPAPLRDALKSRIKYGNEFSLRKRLNEIFAGIGPQNTALIALNSATFISDVVDTRNYLTHYSDDLKEQTLEGADLFNANLRLKILLTILLLRELGIDEGLITELVSSHGTFRRDLVRSVDFD